MFYVAIKFVISSTHDIQIDDEMQRTDYFHNTSRGQINLKQDIQAHMCPRILYHSAMHEDDSFSSLLANECGFQLDKLSSRDSLVEQLRKSLDVRIAYQAPKMNLNRSNATTNKCIVLPGPGNASVGPIYQVGIVRTSDNAFEIHMTDSAGSSVIHIPYSQGSSYNEYRLPVSDLNLGVHLIEICLANAIGQRRPPGPRSKTLSPNDTIAYSRNNSIQINLLQDHPKINEIKWRLAPYPTVTGVFLIPIATGIVILIAFFCTNIASTVRVADANEHGLQRYLRLSGASSSSYWLSELLVSTVTNFMHSLFIGLVLGTAHTGYPYDPICDIPMTMRWLILFTYSLSATSLAILLGSLFDRSSHALLTLCLIASSCAMYPLLLILQWTPYGYKSFSVAYWLAFFNPAGVLQAVNIVLASVAMQSGGSFRWANLSDRIINGGYTDFSVGELWALLLAQILIAIIFLISIDEYRYTTTNLIEFVPQQLKSWSLSCCRWAIPPHHLSGTSRTKTIKSAVPNPNRVCCSLRNIQVRGETKIIPFTKDEHNPRRISRDLAQAMRPAESDETQTTKTSQFLVNRKPQPETPEHERQFEQSPVSLDDAIKQHLVWYKTTIKLENLSLNFHFNQVTFVLGQTDLKDLLFETLLGLHRPDAGSIVIDDVKYSPATMSEARRHIGYLSDRDIFYHELTIFENLQLFGSIREPEYKSFDSESLYVLSLLHLTNRRDNLPAALTHRSARKLALAVALVGYTKLLLLTEPTLNLRWRPRCQVYNLLRKYKSIRSIVVDTSDVDEAVAFGDRIVLLRNGSADLNDEPNRLGLRLGCGYRLVFEPTTGDGRSVNSQAIKALEKLTDDIFKQDKFDLNATKHSIHDDSYHLGSKQTSKSRLSPRSPLPGSKSPITSSGTQTEADEDDRLHRAVVIVKINQTAQSQRGLCTMLKMFASNNISGLRLAQLNYESLEDILVLRMSRAVYPNLPPDLLLSLQHRFQAGHKTRSSMPISVQQLSRLQSHNMTRSSVFNSSLVKIIKDRLAERSELILSLAALLVSLLIVAITLLSLRYSLKSNELVKMRSNGNSLVTNRTVKRDADDYLVLEHAMVERLYRYRVGFYVLEGDREGVNNESAINGNGYQNNSESLLRAWKQHSNLLGVIKLLGNNETDSQIVARLIDKGKDLPGSLIIYDPRSGDTIVIYEPHLPHVLLATIKTFINFLMSIGDQPHNLSSYESMFDDKRPRQQRDSTYSSSLSTTRNSVSKSESSTYLKTSRFNFDQSWHEMIQGFYARRLIYGIGFALAEGFSIGILLLAPIRHRCIVIPNGVQVGYWFKMAIVDLCFSFINIAGYLILFVTIEGLTSVSLISSMFLVFFLYKLASLPIPYLTSLIAETSLYGFLFILLLYFTIAWDFDIFLRSYIDWAIISNPYAYTISNWVLFGIPLTGLTESLVIITQVNLIAVRCQDVPAYAPSINTVSLDGVQKSTIVDDLLEKVAECLTNGKTFVNTDVLHSRNLGIVWPIYLIMLFALISWTFLLTAERFFGLIMRRFISRRSSMDPLKAFVRVPDNSSTSFAWDKERDRLVSDFVRCLNEINYTKSMAKNCLLLRIWLKPLDNLTNLDGRLANIIEPLMSLGCTKNNVQIELRTTLQIFIRLGDESRQCRVDKVDLIETFSRYAATHSDMIAKFAVVDWTRENLYKILLHGYYNNKTMLSS